MAEADEDDDAQVEQTDDEDRQPGTEGEGAAGKDDGQSLDEEGDLSAKRAGAGDDEGTPPSRGPAQSETQPRRSERFQRLANENREYKERLERLERERENDRQQWQRQQTQLNEQQERDRLALMTPDEKTQYFITQDRQQRQAEMQQFRMQTAAQLDKSTFEARATTSPSRRRLQAEVENMFQDQMRKGQPTDRETIYFHLLGKQADAAASNSRPRQQAQRRVENQRVTPSSGKGDTARRTDRKPSTAEERLKDVLI